MIHNSRSCYYFMCFTILTAFIDHVRLWHVFNKSWKVEVEVEVDT